MRPPANRGRILRAIELTRVSRGEALIPDSISADAAHMLIKWINDRRARREEAKVPYELHSMVQESVNFFGFDPGRRRAYELVVLRYYSLMSQLQSRLRRMKSSTRTRKASKKKVAENVTP